MTCTEAASWFRAVSVPASSRPAAGADEVGKEVVGQVVSAPGDHVIDVVVELPPRAHDLRFIGDIESEAEGFEDVVRPQGKLLQSSRGAPSNAQMIGIG